MIIAYFFMMMALWFFLSDFYIGEFVIALFHKNTVSAEAIEFGEKNEGTKETVMQHWTKVRYQINGYIHTTNIIRDRKDYIGRKIVLAYDVKGNLYRRGVKRPYFASKIALFSTLYMCVIAMLITVCITVVISFEKELWKSAIIAILLLMLINALTLKIHMRYFYKYVN